MVGGALTIASAIGVGLVVLALAGIGVWLFYLWASGPEEPREDDDSRFMTWGVAIVACAAVGVALVIGGLVFR